MDSSCRDRDRDRDADSAGEVIHSLTVVAGLLVNSERQAFTKS